MAPPRHKLKRTSVPVALANSLRERILNGEFQAGDAIVQDSIAAEYECSRMPVREALRQLEAEGLIVTKVHKGAFVSSVPPEQVMELFELRAMLEVDLLERSIPHLTEEHLHVSEGLLKKLDQTYETNEISSWGTLNWEFHKSLYAGADRIQTMTVVQGINTQVERFIRLQLSLNRSFGTAETEHHELLRLCRERDVKGGCDLLRRHILDAGKELVSSLMSRTPPKET